MAEEKLAPDVQTFIVHALACFDSPSTVAAAVKSEYGLTISRQLVETYNPTRRAGARAANKWKAIFDEARKAFLEDSSQIGISHRTVRLRALERMSQKAETAGNLALAAQLHEQAAKEVGESYTNRHKLEHMGEGGGALQSEVTVRFIRGAEKSED